MEAREEAQSINLHWLLRLRWVAIVGQIAVVLGVDLLLGIRLPIVPIVLIIGFEVLSNMLSTAWMQRSVSVSAGVPAFLLGTDVALLTVLLAFTGGPMNPFSFLYMVHVTLAAVTLPARSAWALTALSLLGYGLLFWLPEADPNLDMAHAHHQHMELHLQGMYFAFAVAAGFIVYFVQRVTAALAEREAQLAAAHSLAERHQKFAALTTLTAGAAHELATPLSTIAVAAGELERLLERHPADGIDDVRLIRSQVKRCREILHQMAADAGPQLGETLVVLPLRELVEQALEEVLDREPISVSLAPAAAEVGVEIPQRAMLQVLRGILKNAQQASPPLQPIEIRGSVRDGDVHLAIRDHGTGMARTVLDRAGEPFFTTKSPGEGMGLGLFLARTLVERLGGRLDLDSRPGHGTTVTIVLPSHSAPGRRGGLAGAA